MLNVQAEIRDWLLKQQDWLQETADRILRQGMLTTADFEEVCRLLKTSAGQAVTTHRLFNSLLGAQSTGDELRLINIRDVQGIENLSPRHPLCFGTGNLTVVYGHNGSGKSSYTRIFKKASGKPRAVELKPNVFDPKPALGQCQITYRLGGQQQTVPWSSNEAPIEAVRAIDIFDSDEATHYLNRESAVSYTPPTVALFESLAAACDQLKRMLQAEQGQMFSTLPAMPALYQPTVAGRHYRNLNANLTDLIVQNLVLWTEEKAQELDKLVERLKVADPVAEAKKKRATKSQVEQIMAALIEASVSFGVEGIQEIRALRGVAQEKRRIALEAAHVKTAKLDGVGSATWRALWEAARNYSQVVYPQASFPVTDESRCLLCHQELDKDAQQRLKDFEVFVQGQLESAAQSAEQVYSQKLRSLPSAPSQQMIETQCEAAGLAAPGWKNWMTTFWSGVRQAYASLMETEREAVAGPVQSIAEVLDTLKTYCDQLESEAVQFDEDSRSFDRAQAEKDKIALEAQRWVAEQDGAVRQEVDRLRQIQALEVLKGLTNSRPISVKAGKIAEQVITEAYVTRFNRELQLLGASHIQVELIKTRISRGQALHQLRLKGAQVGHALPDEVLSEGERRIISLAAFLADVAEKPQAAPFIFDDPISSLDHEFEGMVAIRLGELAKTRQVIVFTHRLSLYGAMEDVARKIGADWKSDNYQALCIETYSGAAGQPVDQTTWGSKPKAVNNNLLARLDSARKAGELGGGEAYRQLAQGICSDFRKLLERTVEDDLLNEVVKRHRRSVTTDNRLAALSVITLEDCRFIDNLMTKYSCYEHSQSLEAPIRIPEEPELRADVEALKQWREGLVERRKQELH